MMLLDPMATEDQAIYEWAERVNERMNEHYQKVAEELIAEAFADARSRNSDPTPLSTARQLLWELEHGMTHEWVTRNEQRMVAAEEYVGVPGIIRMIATEVAKDQRKRP